MMTHPVPAKLLNEKYGPNYMTPRRYQHSGDPEDDMSRKGS